MRVIVDGERCMGNGICVDLADHTFALDDEGYARAIEGQPAEDAIASILAAARSCPTNAIEVVDD